ncbi:hypothetical protein BKA70DRAFT_4975 [Coprinopsis sp. MPI-PUGE-AT-0042]|nr:hypothetical protein BKA70DRAFT_4975 [Coprinopsis sp. MPI-PUGE-AT-0042]
MQLGARGSSASRSATVLTPSLGFWDTMRALNPPFLELRRISKRLLQIRQFAFLTQPSLSPEVANRPTFPQTLPKDNLRKDSPKGRFCMQTQGGHQEFRVFDSSFGHCCPNFLSTRSCYLCSKCLPFTLDSGLHTEKQAKTLTYKNISMCRGGKTPEIFPQCTLTPFHLARHHNQSLALPSNEDACNV